MVDMLRLDDDLQMKWSQLDMTEVAKLAPQVDKVKKNVLLGIEAKDAANDGQGIGAGWFLLGGIVT